MENGRVRWKTMDIEDQIQGKVTGDVEQLHPIKGMLEIEIDQSLEVNLAEKDLMDSIEVSQEEMETDLDLDHHQDRKVNWQRMWRIMVRIFKQ